jgi:peptidoglycan-N-acetylglucosamine deacetylase
MPVLHVHVDADDLWIYAAEYGIAAERLTASVYEDALPRFLELFEEAGVRATFFVVGRDLERVPAAEFCREATARGHEIANHSFTHPIALHRLSAQAKDDEIGGAHDAIATATGVEPAGFRAPGYYLDGDIVRSLERRGYLYDSSILPSYVQPLIKLYIRAAAGRSIDKQFGTPRSPLVAQAPRRITASLIELPISVFPGLRLPIHSTFSFQLPAIGRRFVNATFGLRREGVLLFHAIDALGTAGDVTLDRRVLPLRLPLERRLESIRDALAVVRGRSSQTTRERFADLGLASFPRSRILRFDA